MGSLFSLSSIPLCSLLLCCKKPYSHAMCIVHSSIPLGNAAYAVHVCVYNVYRDRFYLLFILLMTLNGHTRFKVEFLAFFYPSVFFHVWKCFINVLPLACLPTEITFVRPLYIRLFSSPGLAPVLYLVLLTP